MYFSHKGLNDKGSHGPSPVVTAVSCSDCKMELVTEMWTNVLLNWLNRCVKPEQEIKELSPACLVEIVNRYKEDIVDDDIDRAILCTDDLEPFLRYKYPILRLRYLTEEKDQSKKHYVMTSVLFYHCCISSHTGTVETDICTKMSKHERELILKFCESLSDMEITINNVEVAIRKACEAYPEAGPSNRKRLPTPHVSKSVVRSEEAVSDPEMSSSNATSDASKKKRAKKVSTLSFKASVTVMPSRISFSKTSLNADSSVETTDTYSTKVEDYSEATTESAYVTEKDDDSYVTQGQTGTATSLKTETSESRSQKFRCGSASASGLSGLSRTDDSMRTVVTVDSSRQEKLRRPEPVLTIRPADTREAKIDKYRDNRRQGEKRVLEGADNKGVVSGRAINIGSTGDRERRYRRDVNRLSPRIERGDTSLSNESTKTHDDDPCGGTVTTDTSGELSEDTSAIDYRSGDTPECRACKITDKQDKEKRKAMEKDGVQLQRFQTFFVKHFPVFNFMDDESEKKKWVWIIVGGVTAVLLVGLIIGVMLYPWGTPRKNTVEGLSDSKVPNATRKNLKETFDYHPTWAWQCSKRLCMKVYKPKASADTYPSLSRCILLCTGPQLWPHPLGMTHYSKELVALATDRLEYKFEAVPSDMVNQYLSEAFKLFLGDLAKLERIEMKSKNRTQDIEIKKMHINLAVETDPDPRLKVNTDESYYLKINNVTNIIQININSPSFAGVRHGLETLSQVILLDQSTGHLITLSEVIVKDAPSFKYRGLMLDTARNYIPLHDILRTIDGMATCKLNTFHWRITDSASFPLLLPSLSNLFEYGAYDRSMVYTKQDVKTVVNRAGVRGIRVLIEVALPGPVGRAWVWSDDATCPKKNDNFTCDNVICLRLKMKFRVFELLQHLYSEIIDMTGVDDVFHMSDSVFSLSNCYFLIDEREGFLEKALERLRRANKGFLPKLPIIWHTPHLSREMEAKTWERFGVQVYDWPSHPDNSLSKYKVIHSGRWDLSCDVQKQRCTKYRSWQEMYSWKSWRNMEVFSIEGGEALLWTDLVDSGNLDFHLWPRAAAVAERLWSDLVANASASGEVYMRLDNHRWRMLLRGLQVQPIWPVWCSFNPPACLSALHRQH